MNRFIRSMTLAIASALFTSAPAHAATYFVSPCGSDGWAGVSPVCAFPTGPKRTIQAAINAAVNGDFVHVLPGEYVGVIDFDGKAITVLGVNGAAFTTINGNGAGPVVSCNSLEGPGSVLRGFTVKGGSTNQSGGGMLIALASPTVLECIFRDNFAQATGGGIACIAASPTIADCTFIDNQADELVGGDDLGMGAGMSIAGGAPAVSGCYFFSNDAHNSGGGMSITGGAAPTIEDCTFEQNFQYTYCPIETCPAIHSGSAVVSIGSEPSFDTCVFHDNRLGGHGAVFVSGGEASFNNCDFTLNRSANVADPWLGGGGLGAQDGANVTLFGCSFTDNHSNTFGGAVYLKGAFLSATLCGFSDNETDNGPGGAIRAENSSLALALCTFSDNTASTSGGAISTDEGPVVTLQGCAFTGNIAAGGNGGAVEAVGPSFTASDCTFNGNQSAVDGGGMKVTWSALGGSTTLLDGCQFTGNSGFNGGGLRIDFGDTTIRDCLFDDNTSSNTGGGLSSLAASFQVRIEDSQFTSNSSSHGGAVSVRQADMIRCVFTGNSAEFGGAASAASAISDAKFISCRFSSNSATTQGAAAHVGLHGQMSFINCTVHHNTAPASAGAISSGQSLHPLRIFNTLVANNSGGGVSVTDAGTIVRIANSIIWGNSNGAQISAIQADVQFSDVQGGAAGVGNINANPLFAGALGGNYHLLPNSPCIDAGRNMSVPQDEIDLDTDANTAELIPLDFDGNPRFSNNIGAADAGCGNGVIVDMGPFESAGVGAMEIMPADVDSDGQIDFDDITLVIANWGPCPGGCCLGDVNMDGNVDFDDLNLVLAFYGF